MYKILLITPPTSSTGMKLKVENTKTTQCKKIMKLAWKYHAVARGKSPLSWNQGVPHVKLVQENHKLIKKDHEIGRALWEHQLEPS